MTSTSTSSRQPAAARRRAREREILRATRELFDESGVRDAQIEDIARAVGVNRAIIYRHFSGKEELFALTLVSYLDDLQKRLAAAARQRRIRRPSGWSPWSRRSSTSALEYPAFVDCAQTLMRRPGPELLEEISEGSLFRLGRGISACLTQLSDVLDDGRGRRRVPRRGLHAAGQPDVRQRPRRPPARPRRRARQGVRPRHPGDRPGLRRPGPQLRRRLREGARHPLTPQDVIRPGRLGSHYV